MSRTETTWQDRFWAKVDKRGPDECWPWLACLNGAGYGAFGGGHGSSAKRAHRVAWELMVGPIPEGLKLDHKCHNNSGCVETNDKCPHRRCCNPAHLEPVTIAENVRRGNGGIYNRSKTHCPQGHEYTPDNTYMRPDQIRPGKPIKRGGRCCRTCKRDQSNASQRKNYDWEKIKAYRAKQKAKRLESQQ